MKRYVSLAVLGLTTVVALTACSAEGEAERTPASSPESASVASSDPGLTSEMLHMEAPAEVYPGARQAYAAALERMLRERVLPDGTDTSDMAWEYPDMEQNQFAVFDVNGDGEEELIVYYTTDMMAGNRGFICGWEKESGRINIQLEEYPRFTFYENGVVQVGWSHNQSAAGRDFWPYSLYCYNSVQEFYYYVGSVRAWGRDALPTGYPEKTDTSGAGFVYYIGDDMSPLDQSIYETWRYIYVRDSQEIQPEYLALTEENIQRMLEQ